MKHRILISAFACLFFPPFSLKAQECEKILESANTYYEKNEYSKAERQYMVVISDCGENYGGAGNKLKACKNKIQEDADFKNCNTVRACDKYISKWPNGRYYAKVRDKRQKLSADSQKDETAYQNCTSIEACEEYLRRFPNGKHTREVRSKLAELQSQLAYQRKLDSIRQLKVLEARVQAYMEITKVEFANSDEDGNFINPYGFTRYDADIRLLRPRISYNSLIDEPKYVTIDCKIVSPQGKILQNEDSPNGYTYTCGVWVQDGTDKKIQLPAWGSTYGDYYQAGDYQLELWFEDKLILRHTFTVYGKTNELSRGQWKEALKRCNDNVTHVYNSGSYKGQLYNGNRDGVGMYYWFEKDCYIGNFVGGLQNGVGMQLVLNENAEVNNCTQCKYYVGDWQSGNKSGKGTCYDRLGNLIYYGRFSNNSPVDAYPMKGFTNYKFECIEYQSGDFYIGETKDGKRHGLGIYIWNNGNSWYGNWKDDLRFNEGLSMEYNGSVSNSF